MPHIVTVPESFLEILAKLGTTGKSIGTNESHVVFTQRVGDNEMRPIFIFHRPIGEVIRIRVGIVEKSSLLDHKFARIDIGLSLIKAKRTSANEMAVNFNGTCDVFAFRFLIHVSIVPPTVPMARNLPSCIYHGLTY